MQELRVLRKNFQLSFFHGHISLSLMLLCNQHFSCKIILLVGLERAQKKIHSSATADLVLPALPMPRNYTLSSGFVHSLTYNATFFFQLSGL